MENYIRSSTTLQSQNQDPDSPSTTPIQDPTNQTQDLPSTKKQVNQKLIYAIFGAVILLLVAIIIILLMQRTDSSAALTPFPPDNPTPPPTNTPQTTIDPTVGWETYTNSTFNYTFTYPEEWELSPPIKGGVSEEGTGTLTNYPTTGDGSVENYMNHGIVDWKAFMGDKLAIKVNLFVGTQKYVNELSSTREFLASLTKMPESQLKVGNLPTTTYRENPTPGDIEHVYLVVAENESKYVSFGIRVNNDNNTDIFSDKEWLTLAQILSSFQFQ